MSEQITIVAPSWKRPTTCFTHQYLPDIRYVVCESQAASYEVEGLPVWICPDSAQGSVCRVRNWILDNADTERVLIVDDDIHFLGRWNANRHKKMNTDEAMDFIAEGFELAEQFGVRFWGINIIQDKGAYREYTPFSLNNVVLGPFGGFIKADCRYDERLPLKEDYDLSLQMLNKHRQILRINYAHYVCKQHTNKGGCAAYRTISREQEQFEVLQRKWGSKIVSRDSGGSKVNRKKQQTYDINPIIRVPIAGI